MKQERSASSIQEALLLRTNHREKRTKELALLMPQDPRTTVSRIRAIVYENSRYRQRTPDPKTGHWQELRVSRVRNDTNTPAPIEITLEDSRIMRFTAFVNENGAQQFIDLCRSAHPDVSKIALAFSTDRSAVHRIQMAVGLIGGQARALAQITKWDILQGKEIVDGPTTSVPLEILTGVLGRLDAEGVVIKQPTPYVPQDYRNGRGQQSEHMEKTEREFKEERVQTKRKRRIGRGSFWKGLQ